MHFFLILVVMLAFYPVSSSPLGLGPSAATALTVLYILTAWLLAAAPSRILARRLRLHPERRPRIYPWFSGARVVHFVAVFGGYLALLFAAQWGSVVREGWGLNGYVLIDELLLLAPFLLSLILGWSEFYTLEKALRRSSLGSIDGHFWTRSEYVGFYVRHYLGLVLAPIFIFLAIHDLLILFFPGLERSQWFEIASLGFMGVTIILVMPWLLAVIWGAQSLPAGPLRDRLEAVARRLGFRYTDILLWNTRGGIVNAMVTGILPVPRYVLLSDGLVEDLTPEEIEAVFGHEIGHVKHQHMPLYLGFLVMSLALISALLPSLGFDEMSWSWIWGFGNLTWGIHLLTLAILGGYVFLVFGFLSRRCERQADVYGCKAVSCQALDCQGHEELREDQGGERTEERLGLCPTGVRTFIQALEKVASLNGIRRDKPSWRHSSIARRVGFLEKLLIRPEAERRFQHRLFLTKCVLFMVLSIGLGGAFWWNHRTEEKRTVHSLTAPDPYLLQEFRRNM